MKIRNARTGEVIENACRGCMCHEMAMTFGRSQHRCAECGCPHDETGFNELKLDLQASGDLEEPAR